MHLVLSPKVALRHTQSRIHMKLVNFFGAKSLTIPHLSRADYFVHDHFESHLQFCLVVVKYVMVHPRRITTEKEAKRELKHREAYFQPMKVVG